MYGHCNRRGSIVATYLLFHRAGRDPLIQIVNYELAGPIQAAKNYSVRVPTIIASTSESLCEKWSRKTRWVI